MDFNKSFEALIGNEGGFTRDPKDRGNWTSGKVGVGELKGTNFGLSAMTYPNEDIKGMTIDRAKFLYKRDFWDAVGIPYLPESVQFDMFDMAVNSGIVNAIRTLQKSVGVTPTGNFGNMTKAAVKLLDPQLLDKRLAAYRLLFICDIATFPEYGKGWVRRVANNLIKD